MITLTAYFGNNRPMPQVAEDAHDLIDRVCLLLAEPDCPLEKPRITSGFRTPIDNARVGGAKNSRHMTGEAVDIGDLEGKMGAWLSANPHLLVKHGLWMEHPEFTKPKNGRGGWCHLQNTPPKSGNRLFKP